MIISVTGCSTCSRVLTSRKKKPPLVEHELDGAGADVADRLAGRDGGGAQLGAQRVVDRRRRRLLDDLLVAALDRAFALEQVHDLAVRVAEDLHLDMARRVDEALEEDGAVAERGRRLPPGARDRLGEVVGRVTIRMPRPPPPNAALTRIGKPIGSAAASRSPWRSDAAGVVVVPAAR